jgi:hypothetical protein
VGNDLVTVDSGEGQTTATVTRAGKVVYHTIGIGMRPDNPIKGLSAWGDHWVLEVLGEVVIDGNSLNKELGYDEIFNWRLLKGQPFYFFKKNNKIGISYAGKTLPQQYDEVMHYQCCEPAMFNPRNFDNLTQFHALRNGTWYYVEAGLFENQGSGTGTPAVGKDGKPLYQEVTISEQGISFKAPAGWQRVGQEWAWTNNSTPAYKVGVKWRERTGGWEPTALLPANGVNQDAYDVQTELGNGRCYWVKVTPPGGDQSKNTEEKHYIILTEKYAFDFYGVAADSETLWKLGAYLNDMMFSARLSSKSGPAGATATPTPKP